MERNPIGDLNSLRYHGGYEFAFPPVRVLRASLCKILISSFAHEVDFAHNFSVDFF